MKLECFSVPIPKELIAQIPAEPRDSSRLMIVKENKMIEHRKFSNLPDYLNEGDVLVLNNTKVIPAKIFGLKKTGGKVEILLVKKISEGNSEVYSRAMRANIRGFVEDNSEVYSTTENVSTEISREKSVLQSIYYECLIKGKNIVENQEIANKDGCVIGVVKKKLSSGRFVVELNQSDIIREGAPPLPPYIKNTDVPLERYNTVYGYSNGSIAAPTAGLHFTEELLERIKRKGVCVADVTLHIGLGTFLPVKAEKIEDHKMEEEYYEIGLDSAEKINSAERVIAVGTSTVRAIESSCKKGKVIPSNGKTNLYIYPGYKFKSRTDSLITNFHLPSSTNLLLVCAFAGTEKTFTAYREAISQKYRFYSFGDAMLVGRENV